MSSSMLTRTQVLFAGICSLVLAMGIARFAYTPLLPIMMTEAALTHAGGGWLAAINYAGYLIGVLVASSIGDTKLKDRLYRWGMVVAVISTAMMAITTDFTIWALSRWIAGLSSAAGLMLGSGLILNWLIRQHHRSELGIHFSGIGLGIAVCSAAAVLMTHHVAWDIQWMVLACLGGLLLIPALVWFPRRQLMMLFKNNTYPCNMRHPMQSLCVYLPPPIFALVLVMWLQLHLLWRLLMQYLCLRIEAVGCFS